MQSTPPWLLTDPAAALGRFPDAIGLGDIKKGFAISPAWDALFALGFPHMLFIVDGHKDDKNPRKAAEKADKANDPEVYPHEFPRGVVSRYLRATAINSYYEDRWNRALNDGSEFTKEEATARLRKLLEPEGGLYEFRTCEVIYLIEALYGTAFTMDTLLTAFEGWTKWADGSEIAGHVVTALGFLLRRLPAKAAAAAKARLVKLAAIPMDEYLATDFHLLLGGAPAYKKLISDTGRPEGLSFALHTRDPKLLIRLGEKSNGDWHLDPWFVFWAGDAMLAQWPTRMARSSAWRHRSLAIELTLLKSPAVGPVMEVLLTKKRAAPVAEAWLAENGMAKQASSKDLGKPRKQSAGKKPNKAQSRPVSQIEKDFDELAQDTADKLDAVRGKRKEEQKVLKASVDRYATLRSELGEPPLEAVVHFFGADGVAWQRARKPALQRLRATEAELSRWIEILEAME